MNETEKDVLGADVGVVEETRLFLGEYNDPAGSVCKPFEQWDHPVFNRRILDESVSVQGVTTPVDGVA